ncbi:hypothetical protein NQ317_011486 [Molorchus minor]|uniref:Sodium channel protein Nach n=1 Tax=Molorchus minor TaxID=1323400 RepID=A0ABQ9IWL2_9CUCU|nr:hypothetical protein NQ317_011486 [Molorchus minor]
MKTFMVRHQLKIIYIAENSNKMKLEHSENKTGNYPFISDTFKDFAKNTSVHGLKYVVKNGSSRYEKIFWILIVLFGLCGSAYMTTLFWRRYVSNPTRTSILSAYAPTTAVPFPAVTICNLNRIFLSKVEHFIQELKFSETDEPILRNAFPQLLSFTHPNALDYNMTELEKLQEVLQSNGYLDPTVVMDKISQDCEEMLSYCVWNRKHVPCMAIFKRSVSYSGICCSFNIPNDTEAFSPIYSSLNGLSTGLRVLLDPMLQPVQYSPLYTAGFKILIHNPSEYIGSQSDTKLLPVGKTLYMQVSGKKMMCSNSVSNLPISQRECYYPDEFKLKYYNYSESNCLVECEHSVYLRECGCVPFYYTFTGNFFN